MINKKTYSDSTYLALSKELNFFFKKENISPCPQFLVLLWHFTSELYKKCLKNNISKLFFLSREGYFLKLIFEEYQQIYSGDNKKIINTYYFEISRKASFIVNLKTLDSEKFKALDKKRRSIEQFSILYGLPINEMQNICKVLNLNFCKKIFSLPSSNAFNKLKNDKSFQKFYENTRISQKSAFLEYVKTFNFEKNETIHLVDVGWQGTIQDNLHNFFNGNYIFSGHYIGLRSNKNLAKNNEKEGLIFDSRKKQKAFHLLKFPGVIIKIEFLLSNSEGSVIGYTGKENGQVITDKEYNSSEQDFFHNEVISYQKKIKDNFKKIHSILTSYHLDNDSFERCVYSQYVRGFIFPLIAEKKWFYAKYVVDGLKFNKKKYMFPILNLKFMQIIQRLIDYSRWARSYFEYRKHKKYFSE